MLNDKETETSKEKKEREAVREYWNKITGVPRRFYEWFNTGMVTSPRLQTWVIDIN